MWEPGFEYSSWRDLDGVRQKCYIENRMEVEGLDWKKLNL